MADGEINRNGATIRIDDDGGVQVEPADGQEVEYTGPDRGTDAIRDSVNTGEIHTETIGSGDYYYAGDFDGSDADARLDSVLDVVGDGDTIFLENVEYSAERTGTDAFRDRIRLVGGSFAFNNNATRFESEWELQDRIGLVGVYFTTRGKLTVNTELCSYQQSGGRGDIEVNDDEFVMYGVSGLGDLSVTFDAETESGIVDACSRVSVTDNGNNAVGDIA